jgi:hypothetical protein
MQNVIPKEHLCIASSLAHSLRPPPSLRPLRYPSTQLTKVRTG